MNEINEKPLTLFKFWRCLSVKNPNKYQNKIYKQCGNDRKKQEELIKMIKIDPYTFNLTHPATKPESDSDSTEMVINQIKVMKTQGYQFPFDSISLIFGIHIGFLISFLFYLF